MLAGGDVTHTGRATLNPTGLENLTLLAGNGADNITVNSGHLYTTIRVEGGNPDDADRLSLADASTDVAVGLSTSSVTGFGGTITYTGIGVLDVDASDGTMRAATVTGRTSSEIFMVTPTGANSVTVAVWRSA